MATDEFMGIFERLRGILTKYEDRLIVKQSTADSYTLDAPYSAKWNREIFFGAVQIKKKYVSFHLMPVYMFPDLLDGVAEPLRKRMQGKSCFNFKRADPELFGELETLTQRAFARFEEEGLA